MVQLQFLDMNFIKLPKCDLATTRQAGPVSKPMFSFFSYPTVFHPFLQELQIIEDNFTFVCSSRARNITLGILYGYKLVVHLIILAFTSLKVKVKGLEDAKYITASISMTSTMLVIMLLTTYFLNEFVNWFPALFSTALFISTTFILALVFVPKVWDCVGPSN